MLTFIFLCIMEKCKIEKRKLGTASLVPRFMALAIYE